jgi:hypothetical protein
LNAFASTQLPHPWLIAFGAYCLFYLLLPFVRSFGAAIVMMNWKDTTSKGVKLWAPPSPPQEGPVEAASKRLSRPSIDAKMAESEYLTLHFLASRSSRD